MAIREKIAGWVRPKETGSAPSQDRAEHVSAQEITRQLQRQYAAKIQSNDWAGIAQDCFNSVKTLVAEESYRGLISVTVQNKHGRNVTINVPCSYAVAAQRRALTEAIESDVDKGSKLIFQETNMRQEQSLFMDDDGFKKATDVRKPQNAPWIEKSEKSVRAAEEFYMYALGKWADQLAAKKQMAFEEIVDADPNKQRAKLNLLYETIKFGHLDAHPENAPKSEDADLAATRNLLLGALAYAERTGDRSVYNVAALAVAEKPEFQQADANYALLVPEFKNAAANSLRQLEDKARGITPAAPKPPSYFGETYQSYNNGGGYTHGDGMLVLNSPVIGEAISYVSNGMAAGASSGDGNRGRNNNGNPTLPLSNDNTGDVFKGLGKIKAKTRKGEDTTALTGTDYKLFEILRGNDIFAEALVSPIFISKLLAKGLGDKKDPKTRHATKMAVINGLVTTIRRAFGWFNG